MARESQLIPVPVIVPFTGGVTVRVKRWIVKVAPTALLASMVMVQMPTPLQASDQPAKV